MTGGVPCLILEVQENRGQQTGTPGAPRKTARRSVQEGPSDWQTKYTKLVNGRQDND